MINGNLMKFDALISNPPYQEEGISTRMSPIYNSFYDVAYDMSEKVVLITPGRFLFRAGFTNKEWTERMLTDKHIKVVSYFRKSADIFPFVDIKGGVAITLRDTKQDFGAIGLYSEYDELTSILHKVSSHKDFKKGEFSGIVSSQGIYKFTEALFKDFPIAKDVQGKGTGAKITSYAFDNLPKIFLTDKPDDEDGYIKMIGRSNNKRMIRWVKSSYVRGTVTLNSYKVLITAANGTGAIGETLSTPVIGSPFMGHTDTFLTVGKFDSKAEAEACLKYIKTKFARTMLGTLKATQQNLRDTWANVPLQDFTDKSDIDWSQSVADIDRQLYNKYGLSEEGQQFIETMVKPM